MCKIYVKTYNFLFNFCVKKITKLWIKLLNKINMCKNLYFSNTTPTIFSQQKSFNSPLLKSNFSNFFTTTITTTKLINNIERTKNELSY